MNDLCIRLWVRAITAGQSLRREEGQTFGQSLRREEGQTFTEYAVIVGTIVVGVVAAVGVLRSAVISALSNAAAAI